jgi:hypothetical protein
VSTTRRPTQQITLVAALAVGALAACQKSSSPSYAKDGDTGAAAPATQQSLSPSPSMGDTTRSGVNRSTGAGAMAGDTLGAFNKAAGAPATTPGQPASGPTSGGQKGTGARRP